MLAENRRGAIAGTLIETSALVEISALGAGQDGRDIAGDGFVTATFNYTAPMDVEPEFYLYEPDPGTVKQDPVQAPTKCGSGM